MGQTASGGGQRRGKTVGERKAQTLKASQLTMKSKIADGSITKTLNHDTQAPHMYETRKPGKSYFKEGVTEEQLQQIINERSGTGTVRVSKNGQIKEIINYERDIGVNINPNNGSQEDTNRFTIHYSKTRTHAVPAAKRRSNP